MPKVPASPPVFSLELGVSGLENMARDSRLLGQTACRVYTWDGPWVTLGAFQNPERDLLPDAPVQTVMRPTGGRAVLHGHDVTVGLCAPLFESTRSVRKVYRWIIQPLVAALNQVGVPSAFGEETPWLRSVGRSQDCFAHVSANDVVDPETGAKRCGCALKLTDTHVLVQASIPAGPPLVDPKLVFVDPAPIHFARVDPQEFSGALFRELKKL